MPAISRFSGVAWSPGALMALAIGVRSLGKPKRKARSAEAEEDEPRRFPVIPFFAYWAFFSFLGYTFAGEKMPWLTVHIVLPLIFLAGWAIGRFLDAVNWSRMRNSGGWLLALLVLVLVISASRALGYQLGPEAPFQGSTLEELRSTNGFLAAAGVAVGALAAIVYLRRKGSKVNLGHMAGVIVLVVLGLLTLRTAFRASYLNFDNATEFMVYAHSATGVKDHCVCARARCVGYWPTAGQRWVKSETANTTFARWVRRGLNAGAAYVQPCVAWR